MKIEALKVSDSIGEHSPRFLTIRATNPQFVHQETLRHRLIYIEDALRADPDFSFSVSSTRAVPFPILCAEASGRDTMAMPVYWGAEQKGMSPGGELDDTEKNIRWDEVLRTLEHHSNNAGVWAKFGDPDEYITARECAIRLWVIGGQAATTITSAMVKFVQPHKSIVNRMITPYIHTHCLMSSTALGWLNFFGLRLDGAADPTLRALAEQCWIVWNESTPQKLQNDAWHTPYADDMQTIDEVEAYLSEPRGVSWDLLPSFMYVGVPPLIRDRATQVRLMISTARNARLSYTTFDTGQRSSVSTDIALYNRLVGSTPLHASPAEHVARLDTCEEIIHIESGQPVVTGHDKSKWNNPHLSGNLGPGWIQYRKILPGEALAPLPEAYR